MANFKTHLAGAALVSGAAATAAVAMEMIAVNQAPILFGLGMIGGVLPDVDAENSTPLRLVFNALGLVSAFWAVEYGSQLHFSIAELFLLGICAFSLVRYLLLALFLRLTEHRGVFHSLLAALAFSLATVSASHRLIGSPPTLAWLHGLCLGIGYLTHLVLDELFSVDLVGRRIKRSFGTALKPIAFNNLKTSLALGLLTLALATTLPDLQPLKRTPAHFYTSLKAHLLPKGDWFANIWPKKRFSLGKR
jgi:hypothetical protein